MEQTQERKVLPAGVALSMRRGDRKPRFADRWAPRGRVTLSTLMERARRFANLAQREAE